MNTAKQFPKGFRWVRHLVAIPCMAVSVLTGQAQVAPSPPIGSSEAADRLAIRTLIDAYAHHADRREAQQQAALFTQDAVIEIFDGEPATHPRKGIIQGRQQLLDALAELKKYDVTLHVNGQNSLTLVGDRATGETYCVAHHIWLENGKRTLMVMGIRYYDTFVRQAGQWLFAERKLVVDFTDKRLSTPATP